MGAAITPQTPPAVSTCPSQQAFPRTRNWGDTPDIPVTPPHPQTLARRAGGEEQALERPGFSHLLCHLELETRDTLLVSAAVDRA